MRRKCPICRARIPPSKEMVAALNSYRDEKQKLEDRNETSSGHYHNVCELLADAEEIVGADWDGVTVLHENNDKPSVAMPDYIRKAVTREDIKSVLRWINANRAEDRVNAITGAETLCSSALTIASIYNHLDLMTLLLQLGAKVDCRDNQGNTAISFVFTNDGLASGDANKGVRLLLSWGASFFPSGEWSREEAISTARKYDAHDLANQLKSELGGRRCEIVNLTSRTVLNGKTCVADEYLPDGNQYKVTLETKSKEVLILSPGNLKRRDRTPQDCGYYIEFTNGRTTRHDFDSNEDCRAFVVALEKGETQPVVTEEAEAQAEQAAAELLAELGLDDSSNNVATSCDKAKKTKKKKGGKKKKK